MAIMKTVHVQKRDRASTFRRGPSRIAKRTSGHSPTLDTVKMVEEVIKSDKVFSSKNLLWRNLPRQVQYPTFVKILDYLEQSNKIIYDKEGTIVWTFVDSPAARRSLEESTPL